MTDYEKYTMLWSRFSLLADKAHFILLLFGSLSDCPTEKIREYVQIGREQELIIHELNNLPKSIHA